MTLAPTDLEQHPCRALCRWRPARSATRTAQATGTPARFACQGCGSEWDRSQPWTPVDRDGATPPAIEAETRLR
jgi:hypothetical protein